MREQLAMPAAILAFFIIGFSFTALVFSNEDELQINAFAITICFMSAIVLGYYFGNRVDGHVLSELSLVAIPTCIYILLLTAILTKFTIDEFLSKTWLVAYFSGIFLSILIIAAHATWRWVVSILCLANLCGIEGKCCSRHCSINLSKQVQYYN